MTRHPIALIAALLLALAAAFPSAAKEIRVSDRVFLVKDRPGTPTEFQMIVNAGCADEAGGECRGLAHYLEHLVLVGRNPENDTAAVRFFPEATSNGWTNQKATVFTHRIPTRPSGPAQDLEKLFAFYAARLETFTIPPEEAARERNVVLQEHDLRVASSPYSPFFRKLDRVLLPDHPLGQWPIGQRDEIKALTLEAAHAFQRAWYAPNNVWFVVKGDIQPEAVKQIAEAALANVKHRDLPERLSRRPVTITPSRQHVEEAIDRVQQVGVVYRRVIHVPEQDVATENAVRLILGNYLSSQLPGSLHDVIVDRDGLATGNPSFGLSRITKDTYTISIGADVADDVEPQALLKAIEAYVDGLATLDVSEKAIERLKRRVADQKKSNDALASQVYSRLISWLSAPYDYDDLGRFHDRVAGVDKAQVTALLARLGGPARVVTGIIRPKAPAPEGAPAP